MKEGKNAVKSCKVWHKYPEWAEKYGGRDRERLTATEMTTFSIPLFYFLISFLNITFLV